MPGWIIAAAIASIAITGLLTFVLWRLNAPMRERAKDEAGGDGGYVGAHDGGSGRHENQSNDGTDNSGGDGGGDSGGGDGGGGGGGE